MKLKIIKTFPFAHRGCDVVTYQEGKTIETEDKELIKVALEECWATKAKGGAATESPENKAETPALETKSETPAE